jgi:hypothetical protein
MEAHVTTATMEEFPLAKFLQTPPNTQLAHYRKGAQKREPIGVMGKVLLIKDLSGIFWGWTGVLAGGWAENRE